MIIFIGTALVLWMPWLSPLGAIIWLPALTVVWKSSYFMTGYMIFFIGLLFIEILYLRKLYKRTELAPSTQ